MHILTRVLIPMVTYLHWHVLQAISSLVSSDESPLSLDDAIDTFNVQLSAHGHVTQNQGGQL